jgi:hypothetical protein
MLCYLGLRPVLRAKTKMPRPGLGNEAKHYFRFIMSPANRAGIGT